MTSLPNCGGGPKPVHHVMIFTKYPTPGYAKTRLASEIGSEKAAEISRKLSERIVRTVRKFICSSGTQTILSRIHFATKTNDNADLQLMREWLGTIEKPYEIREELIRQVSGGLGERLTTAFADSFKQDASKVIVVGADIPEISTQILGEAFKRLDDMDVVIGPTEDGGYYLLGIKERHAELFRGVSWSTDSVCETTVRIATGAGLSVGKLCMLRDVDVPQDLPYMDKIFSRSDDNTASSAL